MSNSVTSRSIQLIVFLIGILMVYTLASTSVYSFNPTDLGLVSRLPTAFWIGLVLIGCLWFVSEREQKYQSVALVLTISYLYFIPTFIRKPVWISESYYPFAESVLMNEYGHLVYRPDAPLTSYHYWPLFLYLASTFTLVTAIPHNLILKWFPMLTISLCGLLTFLILRVKNGHSCAIFGAAWFLSSFWLRQHYFGPPGMGYVFFLLIILIASWIFFGNKAKDRTLAALFLLLIVVTTLAHALTSLMALLVVFALYMTHRLTHRRPPIITARLLILAAVFVLGYNMYVSYAFFDRSVQSFSQIFLGMEISLFKETARISGSAAQTLSYETSWSLVLLNGVVAAIAVLLVLKNFLLSRKQIMKDGSSIFWVILLIVVGLFAITAEYGSHEAYQRAFMFGLIPLTYLSVNLLARKQGVLILALVGLIFLNVPAQYGSDSYRLATDTTLAGTGFFSDSTPQDVYCLYKFYPHLRYHDPLKRIKFASIGTLPFTSVPEPSTIENAVSLSDYMILSSLQSNYYRHFLGEDPFEQVDFDRFNRVYDNWSFRMFKHANKA